MADPGPRPDEPAPPPAVVEPLVTAERVGKEAVLLRFNLTDGSLDLADDEEEPMGGDAACWAHLFEDDEDGHPPEEHGRARG
jgi:hypothetical protein